MIDEVDRNRNWIRAHGYSHRFVAAASRLLYGQDLNAAITQLHIAHMTPWGNTAQGARHELVRMFTDLDNIADVLINTWEDL